MSCSVILLQGIQRYGVGMQPTAWSRCAGYQLGVTPWICVWGLWC